MNCALTIMPVSLSHQIGNGNHEPLFFTGGQNYPTRAIVTSSLEGSSWDQKGLIWRRSSMVSGGVAPCLDKSLASEGLDLEETYWKAS